MPNIYGAGERATSRVVFERVWRAPGERIVRRFLPKNMTVKPLCKVQPKL